MAGHELIDRQLQTLARHLTPSEFAELADGLTDTYDDHLARCGNPDAAARAALADFGDADTICAAFVRACPGRTTARRLLLTGPLVGLSWAATLVAGQAWTWPVPVALRLLFGALLILVVLALIITVRERHRYRRVRLTARGAASGLVVLDVLMLGTATAFLAHPSWPVMAVLVASVARIMLVAHSAPAMWAR
ncbi:hypothetical protein AB0M44_43540 [Streptosporangium subroseum]|uniref:hypothetical protein n=1 Tax=Streptosporangium subroseum TaxID=106412 RepID=UPI00342254B0